ncbi:TetR/AcrR family transcriptional regulator [Aliagarivorans taiwanensis]|uniref:TetR/AcrR family transcriptional regulator n=1 Tax=Aliagarivorans taiwanensis TaxID=561966 RepID=UPI0003FA34EC|nr:TetR/AcrR family transcriptional regulator [Aliagarivorans taiwanensis]
MHLDFTPVEPRKQPVQARSRQRFERILLESQQLIVSKGSDAVTMKDIAQASEISIASLYQYFPDKASVIATLAGRHFEGGQQCVQGAFADVTQPKQLQDALEYMLESYYQAFREEPATYAVWQATQSDVRLQALDREDIQRHCQTIEQCLLRVLPTLAPSLGAQLAMLYASSVATAVRQAVMMEPEAARCLLDACKLHLLQPSLASVLQSLGQSE